jgi:GT2 family glycosyltransferase
MEDVDLGFRLNLLGYEAIQVAKARVRHVGSASSGRASRFSLYHGIRNSVFVSVRCVPFPLVCAALPLMVASQFWIGLRTGSFRVRMEAVRDGLRFLPRLIRERRKIQAQRRIALREMAGLLVWKPGVINRLEIAPLPRRGSVAQPSTPIAERR